MERSECDAALLPPVPDDQEPPCQATTPKRSRRISIRDMRTDRPAKASRGPAYRAHRQSSDGFGGMLCSLAEKEDSYSADAAGSDGLASELHRNPPSSPLGAVLRADSGTPRIQRTYSGLVRDALQAMSQLPRSQATAASLLPTLLTAQGSLSRGPSPLAAQAHLSPCTGVPFKYSPALPHAAPAGADGAVSVTSLRWSLLREGAAAGSAPLPPPRHLPRIRLSGAGGAAPPQPEGGDLAQGALSPGTHGRAAELGNAGHALDIRRHAADFEELQIARSVSDLLAAVDLPDVALPRIVPPQHDPAHAGESPGTAGSNASTQVAFFGRDFSHSDMLTASQHMTSVGGGADPLGHAAMAWSSRQPHAGHSAQERSRMQLFQMLQGMNETQRRQAYAVLSAAVRKQETHLRARLGNAAQPVPVPETPWDAEPASSDSKEVKSAEATRAARTKPAGPATGSPSAQSLDLSKGGKQSPGAGPLHAAARAAAADAGSSRAAAQGTRRAAATQGSADATGGLAKAGTMELRCSTRTRRAPRSSP